VTSQPEQGLPIVLDVIAIEEPITLLRTIDRNRCLRSTDGK
jgi:hypothetical protein